MREAGIWSLGPWLGAGPEGTALWAWDFKAWVSDLKHFPESRRQLPGAEQSASCQLSVSREGLHLMMPPTHASSCLDRHLSASLLPGFPKPSVCPASGPCPCMELVVTSSLHLPAVHTLVLSGVPLGREFCAVYPGGRDALISPQSSGPSC